MLDSAQKKLQNPRLPDMLPVQMLEQYSWVWVWLHKLRIFIGVEMSSTSLTRTKWECSLSTRRQANPVLSARAQTSCVASSPQRPG